ncbi:MAG: hypothetical protein ABEK04_04535 [Candidatus Nanohalobium sp.]
MDRESEEQIQRAKNLLMNELKEGLEPDDRIALTLVLYGEKPGASIITDRPAKLEYFCELTGLEHKKISENEIGSEYLVSCDEEELRQIESMGEFLGYPESAVEFFNEYKGNRLNWKYIQFLDELLDEDQIKSNDLQYLYLIHYIPELSDEGVKNAIELGKEREEALIQKDKDSGLDIGSKVIEEEVYSARNFVTQQKIEMLYIDFIMTYDTEELEAFFLDKLPESIGHEQAFDILMMLMGEKPGALVMSPNPGEKNLLEDMCEELDLSYKVTGGKKRSWLDKVLNRDTRVFKDGFFIARDEKALDHLDESEGMFYGYSDRGVGEFLGYPEDSTLFYENSTDPATEKSEQKIEEMKEEGKISSEDEKKLSLISYVPKPDEVSILRAVKIGETREKKLNEIDKDLETSIGEEYLEEIKS